MRLLLDDNLSPRLVDVLTKEGWHVVQDLQQGSIVVIGDGSLRVRRLPIG